MPALLRPLVRMISSQATATFVEPELKSHMDFRESELNRSAWFAGDQFSAVDIQMSFPLETAAARGGLGVGRPKCMELLRRIGERDAKYV